MSANAAPPPPPPLVHAPLVQPPRSALTSCPVPPCTPRSALKRALEHVVAHVLSQHLLTAAQAAREGGREGGAGGPAQQRRGEAGQAAGPLWAGSLTWIESRVRALGGVHLFFLPCVCGGGGLRFRDESIAIAMNRRFWASGAAMVSGFATCGSKRKAAAGLPRSTCTPVAPGCACVAGTPPHRPAHEPRARSALETKSNAIAAGKQAAA